MTKKITKYNRNSYFVSLSLLSQHMDAETKTTWLSRSRNNVAPYSLCWLICELHHAVCIVYQIAEMRLLFAAYFDSSLIRIIFLAPLISLLLRPLIIVFLFLFPPPRHSLQQVTCPLPGVPAGRHGRRSTAGRALGLKRPREWREWLLRLQLCLQGEWIPWRGSCTSWNDR